MSSCFVTIYRSCQYILVLVIIGILLSHSSYFNLVFPPTYSYIFSGDHNRNKFILGAFLGYPRHLRTSGTLVSIFSNICYITSIIIFYFMPYFKRNVLKNTCKAAEILKRS